MIELEIGSYYPRQEQKWKRNADGSEEAEIYTPGGVVSVFTFPGDDQHEAFTSLRLFLWPDVYHARLPRHYHTNWLRRLAYHFARQCQAKAQQERDSH